MRQVPGSLMPLDKSHSLLLEKFLIDCTTISSSPEMFIKHLLFFFVIFNNLIVSLRLRFEA